MPERFCVGYDGGWKGYVPYEWLRAAASALCKVFAAERLLYYGLNGPIDELRILVSCSQHLASTYDRLLHYQKTLFNQCVLPSMCKQVVRIR